MDCKRRLRAVYVPAVARTFSPHSSVPSTGSGVHCASSSNLADTADAAETSRFDHGDLTFQHGAHKPSAPFPDCLPVQPNKPCLQVFLTDQHLGIILEFATGGELFERVKSAGRFDEHMARFFFQQLIAGVLRP